MSRQPVAKHFSSTRRPAAPGSLWLVPLELPGREAPGVDVVLVQAAAAVLLELNLELQLLFSDGLLTDRTLRSATGTAPRPIRGAVSYSRSLLGLARVDGFRLTWLASLESFASGRCGTRCQGGGRLLRQPLSPLVGERSLHPPSRKARHSCGGGKGACERAARWAWRKITVPKYREIDAVDRHSLFVAGSHSASV
jgi:hypothetical protein